MVQRPPIHVSVLVPVFNEQGNIPVLCQRLLAVLRTLEKPFEIILVDDGSSDGSIGELHEAATEAEIKVVSLRRNYGQTAALMAAIDHSSGAILVPIDADLQNDPADIPALLEELERGFDVVSGWRKDRQDPTLFRVLPSRIANRIVSWISGVPLHDYGCTLKAYRRSVIEDIHLYGEMHRLVPIYASWLGARVAEIPVRHHPRVRGYSKYGLERVFKVLLDMIVVKFLDKYFTKPMYVFGGFGMLSLLISVLSGCSMLYLKIFEHISLILTPLPLMTVMAFITGVMSVLMGLLAEMLVRTYFETQKKPIYLVQETVNL